MGLRVRDTPHWVSRLLDRPELAMLARVALTLPYAWSGIDKLINPSAAAEEMARAGFSSPTLVLIPLIVTQLAGSLLLIFNCFAWLGAGALGVFTILVTVVVHAFWRFDGPERVAEMNIFFEHIALVAGFVFAAMAATKERRPSSSAPGSPPP